MRAVIESKMINKGEACAVGKAQSSVFKLPEYFLCGSLNVGSNREDYDSAFIKLVHKPDGRAMAASHLQEGIGLIQDIIRCVNNGLSFLQFRMKGLGLWVILVMRNGEGTEGACINKNLQYVVSPYRYLS